MIDAILTGMTGRITTLNKPAAERPVRQEQPDVEKAPANLDKVTLSNEAIEKYQSVKEPSQSEEQNKDSSPQNLSDEEKQKIEELKTRDAEVRQHEQKHLAAGAPYTSSPTYEYTKGPDGKQYATGGEVDVDTSKESTPEETIEKAKVIKKSATAPAEPSAQDRKVAAQAAQMEREAKAELASAQRDQNSPNGKSSGNFGIDMYMRQSAPAIGSNINLSF